MARTLRTVLSVDVAKFKAGLNNAKASVKSFDRAIVKPLGTMIRKFVRLAAVAGIASAAVAGFAMKAASEIQTAKLRLAGISSGVDDFRKSWSTAYQTFITSPLELGETIGAFTTLKNAGVGTKKVLDAVASASVATGRSVEDLSLSFLSLETEPLRRLGITSRSVRTGLKTAFTMQAIDKFGNAIVRTADNIQDARRNLADLLNIKYGGVLDAFSRTWSGVLSTFRGVRQMAFFELMKGSIKALSPLIMMLNQRIKDMAESGAIARLGERIAQFSVKAVVSIYNVIQAIRNFSLKQFLADNLGPIIAFGAVFGSIMGVKVTAAVIQAVHAIQLLPKAMQSTLGIVGALVIGWQIGRWLDEKLDITYYLKRMVEGFKLLGKQIPALIFGDDAAVEANMKKYRAKIAHLKNMHERAMNPPGEGQPAWMKDAFSKFKPVSDEELAAMVNAGASIGDAIVDGADKAKKGWRDVFDERARRGIGKVFGGGGLGGGDEQKRTKAALAMVKKQGKTNELLQQVVGGMVNNQRVGALAF